MPFKSKAQARFMYARHPKIARRWSREMKRAKRTAHPIRRLPNKARTRRK